MKLSNVDCVRNRHMAHQVNGACGETAKSVQIMRTKTTGEKLMDALSLTSGGSMVSPEPDEDNMPAAASNPPRLKRTHLQIWCIPSNFGLPAVF